ncbi:MAG: hypothetical protein AAFP19_22105 [Bacteroidota bacterium]
MILRLTPFCFLLFIASFLSAQTPVLVTDFNPGEEGGINEFNFEGIFLGDQLLLPALNSTVGEELAVLEDGNLEILKDINEGAASSSPNQFVAFNGKVYFSAYDEVNGGALWATDGTAVGTTMQFDPGMDINSNLSPQGLTISKSGHLYFTHNSTLYRTDGNSLETIFVGVNFITEFQQQANNYCAYGDEVAFLIQVDYDLVELYVVEGNEAVLKGTTGETSGFPDVYGLNPVKQGLLFAINDPFDGNVSGNYLYDDVAGTLEKITSTNNLARRLNDFNDERAIAWVGGKGYFTLNGINSEDELLFNTDNSSFTQGDALDYIVYQDKLLLYVSDGFFGDEFLLYSDGTANGTSELAEMDPFESNMILSGNLAFFTTGISNGFDPVLHTVDMNTGTYLTPYFFNQPSLQVNSIILLGFHSPSQRLYFASNLDAQVGREVYYLDFNISSTEELEKESYTVSMTDDSFEVVSDRFAQMKVEVFSIHGQLLEASSEMTNTQVDLSHLRGLLVLSIEIDGQHFARRFFRP